MHRISSSQDYLPVNIYKDFYYNHRLEMPTIIKEYPNLEKNFIESQYLTCITAQIEHLQKVEYRYGSDLYNRLLKRITALLKNLQTSDFRKEDIFTVDLIELDTFVIFLSSPREQDTFLLEHLEDIAERVRVNLEQEVFRMFYPYLKEYCRPSIGYAMIIKNPMINNMRLIMQLIANSREMGKFLSHKREYMSRYLLQKIIIEQQIYPVFQPIVNFNTLEVIGHEALSRGPADTEFASPLLLFTFAAECGLSFELDRLCRKMAFKAVKRLQPHKKIFVNTLAMTIHDPEFRGTYLQELLDDIKIKPENVVFEISEKLAIDNYDIFKAALKDYSDIGIVHASDDTGAGYSDLERIMELKPGFMKVDISFVKDVDKNYIKQEIIKAMVILASNINSIIIAEGVETKEELDKLKELGVTYGQGYLFAMPEEKINEELNTF